MIKFFLPFSIFVSSCFIVNFDLGSIELDMR